jgi:cyanophycinase
MKPTISVILTVACLLPNATAQVFDERFDDWPAQTAIRGRVIVSDSLPSADRLLQLLPSQTTSVTLVFGSESLQQVAETMKAELAVGLEQRKVQQPASPASENTEGADGPETTAAAEAGTADSAVTVQVWNTADDMPRLPESDVLVFHGTEQSLQQTLKSQTDALQTFVANGQTLVLTGPAAAMAGSQSIAADADSDASQAGLNLLPDCIVDTQYDDSPERRRALLECLSRRPRSVGIGLSPDTALVLSGRKLIVTGPGKATAFLLPGDHHPLRVASIREPRGRRFSTSSLLDLTEWRRDAIDRTLPPFPPARPPIPRVDNGTLVIVGGGGMPKGLMRQMVELAGRPEHARMVYIPCAEQEDVSQQQSTVEAWKRMGVQHATFIHTKDRNRANTDPEILDPLREATGLWFGGGRQWNFADSYYGTEAHKLMKDVLKRGGVIGGSSAGASIQARYLARATPIGNFDIMAPGYERGGLGFLGGVAIDQHFSQRGRQKDMTQLVNRYPQLLGIGLDEATAIIVRQSTAEVVGRGRVYFYDRNTHRFPDDPDYVALPKGSRYDLATRTVLHDSTEEQLEQQDSETDDQQ